MTEEKLDINGFLAALCEAPYRWIKQATDELTEEQLYFRPTEDANPPAWLIWHLSRWRDRISALMAGEPQVWVSDGWAERFGMEEERTGLGDTLEQVAAFHVSKDLLAGYAQAAHDALIRRVSQADIAQLESAVEYTPGATRPAWRALISVVEDSAEHTGQVNYLRGMMAGYGWR